MRLTILETELTLLPEKALYVEHWHSLIVADVHLGKSATFQRSGIAISNQVNQGTLDRLQQLCHRFQPETLYILGDFVHTRASLTQAVLEQWLLFRQSLAAQVKLILGNHDRGLAHDLSPWNLECQFEALTLGPLYLSHEPQPQKERLNLCGHIHPCVKLQSRLDRLRLPCFYFDQRKKLLILPSFGEFTGSHELPLKQGTIAYVIAEDRVVELQPY